MNEHYYAMILAGGGGSRLWPLSRGSKPKQMQKIAGDRSMFQLTVDRLAEELPIENVYVLTTAAQSVRLSAQVPEIPEENFLSTIQSRCQQLTLHRTTTSQDAKMLENTNLTPQEKRQIAFLAAGLPLLITELSHDATKLAERQAIATDAKHILEHPSSYASLKCALRYTDRASALQLIDILLRFIHFQLKHATQPPAMHQLFQKVLQAEKSLMANGNTRLALLKIVL